MPNDIYILPPLNDIAFLVKTFMPTVFKLYMINLKLLMEYGAQLSPSSSFVHIVGMRVFSFAMLICA